MNKERSQRRKQLTRPGQLFIEAWMYDWRKYWRQGRRAATVIQQFFHLSCRVPHSALFIHLRRYRQLCEWVNYCISVAGRWHDNGCFNCRMNMTKFFTAAHSLNGMAAASPPSPWTRMQHATPPCTLLTRLCITRNFAGARRYSAALSLVSLVG